MKKSKKKHIIKQNSSKTASYLNNQRISYFFRSGKKSHLENIFHKLFVRRSILRRKFIRPIDKTINRSFVPLINSFFKVATPFIGLKTRRFGKNINYKIIPRQANRSERKSFISLSKALQTKNSRNKKFSERFEFELKSIFSFFEERFTSNSVEKLKINLENSTSGSSDICEKRDRRHRQAYQIKPYSWGKLKKILTILFYLCRIY